MKITDKTKDKIVLFKEILRGDVFYFTNDEEYGKDPFVRVFDVSEAQCSLL